MTLTTQQHIEDIIRANYPEQVNYWLYGSRRKHTAITLTMKCAACGYEETATIKTREEVKGLLKRECVGCAMNEAAANAHLDGVRLLFGRHRGKTVNAVMEDDPAYLAWVVDCCQEREWLIEKIKSHTRFAEVWGQYVERKAFKVRCEEKEAAEEEAAPSYIPFPRGKPSIPSPPQYWDGLGEGGMSLDER
jgi:hypothetical protein